MIALLSSNVSVLHWPSICVRFSYCDQFSSVSHYSTILQIYFRSMKLQNKLKWRKHSNKVMNFKIEFALIGANSLPIPWIISRFYYFCLKVVFSLEMKRRRANGPVMRRCEYREEMYPTIRWPLESGKSRVEFCNNYSVCCFVCIYDRIGCYIVAVINRSYSSSNAIVRPFGT